MTIEKALKRVGKNIRNLRTRDNLSPKQFADGLGIKLSNTYRLEAGENLTLITVFKLCMFFRVNPSKLFEGINWFK